MVKPRYRLVRVTYASGYIQWNIEKKILWWWDFVDGYFDPEKAKATFQRLTAGTPYKQQEVLLETN